MSIGQQTVSTSMAFGVVGELFLGSMGGVNAQPGIIDSDGVSNPNRVGRVFTAVAGADGHCTIGGTGAFFGVLANPKVYALFGNATDGALGPSLDLPQYAKAEFIQSCPGMIVALGGAGNIGNTLDYDTTTGVIYARAASQPASGAQRIAFASNVATVTLVPAGAPPIGVGSVIVSGGKQTVVTSLGTGTGGNGTYNVATIADASAAAFSYTSVAATGRQAMPAEWSVTRYNIPAAGNAVVGVPNA